MAGANGSKRPHDIRLEDGWMAIRQPDELDGNNQYGPHIWIHTNMHQANMTSCTNIVNQAVCVLSAC